MKIRQLTAAGAGLAVLSAVAVPGALTQAAHAEVPSATATVVISEAGTAVPTTSNPGLRVGSTVAVSGSGWTADTAVRATFCHPSPSSCASAEDESTFFAGSLVADSSGDLSGSLTVTSLGAYLGWGYGSYLVLYQGDAGTADQATNRAERAFVALGSRTVSTGVTIGEQPASVTGHGFYPGETVTVDDNGTSASSTTVADGQGDISTTYTVTDAASTQLTASGIGGNASSGTFVVDFTAPSGTASLSRTSGWPGASVSVNLANVSDNVWSASGIRPSIDWGDGTAVQELALGATTASHAYGLAGSYAVTVTLRDGSSNVSEAINAGTYTAAAPAGTYVRSSSSLVAGQELTLTPSGLSSDVTKVWVDWGDGKLSNAITNLSSKPHHPYVTPGSYQVSVEFENADGNLSYKALGSVTVVADTVKPTVTLTVPSKSYSGASWTTIKGTAKDVGMGPKVVTVQLVEYYGGAYYYWSGTAWKKTTSRANAVKYAKKLTSGTPTYTGLWAVKGAKPAKNSTLSVYYKVTDKANNVSTAKYYAKKITA